MSLSDEWKKIFAGQKARAGEAGQAVVEYILMLVITVSIILGVLYQFNDAFKNYLDNYFGDYIACLLETGELPSLGGEGPTSAECNAGFEDFTVASGRPLVDGGSSGSGDGNGDSGNGSDSSSAGSSSPSGSSGGSSGSRRGGSGNAGRGGVRNGEVGSGQGSKGRPARQRINNPNGGATDNAIAESGDDGVGFRRRRRVIRRKRRNVVPDRFLTREQKRKKKEKQVAVKKSKSQRRASELRKAKFTITQKNDRQITSDPSLGGFTFGKFLKFIIIAGILIAIFIFLGGQALQIKKSWQKGE